MRPRLGALDAEDRVYRAIGHAGRRALLTRLGQDAGRTLGELARDFAMSRQAVSQHLAILEEAELVVVRRHGREKLHYLNPTPLAEAYRSWMAELITPAAEALAGLARGVDEGAAAAAGGRGAA